MKVTKSLVESILVEDIPRLDPVTILVNNLGEGRAEVTIKCYDKSWTAYWGSMGGSVEEFFSRVNVGYLVNCFDRGIRSESDEKDTDAMREVFVKKIRKFILEKRRESYILKEESRNAWDEVDIINMYCVAPEHDHECFNWDVGHCSVDPNIWKPIFGGYCMDDEYYKEEFQQWLWDNVPFEYEPNYEYKYLCRIVEVVKKVLEEKSL
tara:strand:- start:3415 stop:4038 length:624 start_codon:yes stop_codon:yes gene_type:complete